MSVIKVEDIAHVRFAAPDLEKMQSFLGDFGLNSTFHEDGRLYAEWDTTYEKLQFWLGVYRKALEDANGDETHQKSSSPELS